MSTHLQVFNSQGNHLGHFDGEYFYTTPDLDIRVDEDEVYKLSNGAHFGYYENGKITDINGNVKFLLKP